MQYMTGNFVCRLIGLRDMSRHDTVLKERRKTLVTWGTSGLLHDVYTMQLSWQSVATATAAAAVMRQRYHPVSNELNMIGFVRLSVRLLHWLYKLKPITSTSEMTWHLECGRDFEVSRIILKQLLCYLANGPQRIRKERTPGHLTLLCIGCTSVVQCERTVVLWSAEMRNFSAAEEQ